jgi:hypothetical protein
MSEESDEARDSDKEVGVVGCCFEDVARTLTLDDACRIHTFARRAQSYGLVTCSDEHSLVRGDSEKEAWLVYTPR